jgi:diguanylate cyclase (GGDEF)-like protein
VSLVMWVVVAAGVFGLWVTTQKSAFTGFQQHLLNLAREASVTVDPELHERIRRPEQLNDPDYQKAVAPLRRIRKAVPDIWYVYTFVRSGSEVHFVLDAADPGSVSASGRAEQSGVWEVYPHQSKNLDLALPTDGRPGVAVADEAPGTDEWGTFMSGLAPLVDEHGRQFGAIGVDVDASKLLARLAASRRRALLGLIPAGVLIAIVGILFFRIRRRGLADAQAVIDSAQRDKLTGLPNRTVFMEILERSLARVRERRQPACAVLFFDFDRFKQVNDTLGHEAGDELLRQIAGRLQTALRAGERGAAEFDGDMLSRFGGDEFLVLVNDLRICDESVRVAERLLNSLTPCYHVLGHEIHSTASVGIVTTDHCQGSAEEFVRNADVAMYEAKRAGRGCSVVFSEAMHARLTRHLAIETSLRRAIGTDQLLLEYQPTVDLETARRRSVAASPRWKHPTLGSIAASEFVPIAEECGLLVALGQWTIEEACKAMAGWRAQNARGSPDTVSVNISRSDISLGDRFVEHVRRTLERCKLAPQHLQLELSERDVMSDRDEAGKLFGELRRLGVKLALNEFGAGHSSLAVLRGMPVDMVKIDSSYLAELHGNHAGLAVISATLTLIRNLDMVSVADGVENETQVGILQSLGCHCAQGPLFGLPAPSSRVIEAADSPHGGLLDSTVDAADARWPPQVEFKLNR